MGRLLAWLAVAVVVAVASTAPSSAFAQSRAELAESRRLFEAGVAHAEAERWSEARTAFEAALAITERSSILLNLATAEAETGALLESAESYRRFLQIATDRELRLHRTETETALAAVELRIPHLDLDWSALAADDAITIDAQPLGRGALPDGVRLNPGAHQVQVRRGAQLLIDEQVELAEGEREHLTLRAPDLRPARATTESIVPPASTGPERAPADDGLAIGLGVGIGVGVVVIAAVIVGVVVGTSSTAPTYQGNVGAGSIRF